MKVLAIFDNKGETLDRYTVVTDSAVDEMHEMFGMSEGGIGFSQFTTGQYFPNGHNGHLGVKVNFEDLSEESQNHIAYRLWGQL